MNETKKLRIISLEPRTIFLKEQDDTVDEISDESFAASILFDRDEAIEDLSELVNTVYEKFSEACEKRNLKWEAELELGMEFGIKFAAKLKLSPKP